MKTFRKVIFWSHLTTALIAGVVIFIMSVTGALLAFERNIIEFSERNARYVVKKENAQALPPQTVIEKFRNQFPEAKPTSIAINNDESAAWQINLGREGLVYFDPYTGEKTGEANKTVRYVFGEFRNWHRYVAMSGDQRPLGKAITGAANLIFLFIAISGIYIWMPRKLTWSLVKPIVWFRGGLSGKARNFNWHNTIGFWTSVFLIIFTLTATIISYQWASNLLFTLTGNEVPPPQQQQLQPADQAYAYPENLDKAWALAAKQSPTWKSISLRLPVSGDSAVFTIDEGIYWNIFGRSTLTVDPKSAAVIKWDPYGQRNVAQKLRTWFRFTHTGETGGIVGQIIGFVVCIGGAFLVWTGFSLAFRRFGNWLKRLRAEV